MNFPIVMPKIGLTMTEGKIVEWKKAVGDRIEEGEVIFLFETEKVTCEVEAQRSGYLTEIKAGLEQVVQVGEEVGVMATEKGATPARAGSNPVPPAAGVRAGTPAQPAAAGSATAAPAIAARAAGSKVRATPLARKIARERGVDLAALAATAPGGRVRRRDVETALADMAPAAPTAPAPAATGSPAGGGRLVRPSGMRAIIAQKMLASTTQAAQAYMVCSVDATRILEARRALMPKVEAETGVRPTITDLLMKLTASAIGRHPVINTRWTDAGILWLDAIHMGLATALDDGLIVPVIRDIGGKTVGEIAVARNDLVTRGRGGSLLPEEMRDGSFTLSSLGMFGVEEFNAIINQPESAILAVGAIIDTPAAVDGAVAVRPVMKLTLTYDHRIIDGARAGAFMRTLKEIMEEPVLVLA